MNALVSKFKKVELKATTLIPSDDKVAMDLLHRQYEDTMEQLDEWRMFFESEDNKAPHTGFKLKVAQSWGIKGTMHVERQINQPDPFIHQRYFVGYPLRDINKLMTECRTKYIASAYDFFAVKYSIRISKKNDAELIKQPKLSYLDVVDDIRKQLGGLNFNVIAKEQIIDRFRQMVYRKQNAKLANKNIELINYLSTDYGGSGRRCYNSNKSILGIEDAVMLFERGHAQKSGVFNDQNFYNDYVDFTRDYSFPDLDKLECVRFFMNNKVILKFKTAVFAQEFFELFDLESLKDTF